MCKKEYYIGILFPKISILWTVLVAKEENGFHLVGG